MKRFYCRFRVLLLTLTFGLVSVLFFNSFYESWIKLHVELPTVISESPLYIYPKQVLTPSVVESRKLINQERDLSLYEFGGKQTDCIMIDSKEVKRCKVALEKSRKFILNHWQTKTKGFIYLTSTTIDAIRHSQIFIEPDKNGDWHIVWVTEGWNVAGRSPLGERTVYVTDIRSVRLKRATEDNYNFETGTNYLSFLSKDGEEVEGW